MTRPRARMSSGTYATPRRDRLAHRARRGTARRRAASSRRCGRSAPPMTAATARAPDPASPVRPRISPRAKIERNVARARPGTVNARRDQPRGPSAASRPGAFGGASMAPPDDHRDQPGLVDLGRVDDVHQPPVAEHADAIGDRQYLVQVVGDVDDRHPACGEVADEAEEKLSLRLVERRRRLVEQQHAAPPRAPPWRSPPAGGPATSRSPSRRSTGRSRPSRASSAVASRTSPCRRRDRSVCGARRPERCSPRRSDRDAVPGSDRPRRCRPRAPRRGVNDGNVRSPRAMTFRQSGGCAPERIFRNVDLPAPFLPTSP